MITLKQLDIIRDNLKYPCTDIQVLTLDDEWEMTEIRIISRHPDKGNYTGGFRVSYDAPDFIYSGIALEVNHKMETA